MHAMMPVGAEEFEAELQTADMVAHAFRKLFGAGEVWRGLSKNATEGMASPRAIIPWTFILLLGQVLPAVVMVWSLLSLVTGELIAWHPTTRDLYNAWYHHPLNIQALVRGLPKGPFRMSPEDIVIPLQVAAYWITFAIRLPNWHTFRQPFVSILLHPLGVLLLVVIQWCALFRKLAGHPAAWRGRVYTAKNP